MMLNSDKPQLVIRALTFLFLLLGIIFTILGIIFYYLYFNAPSYSLKTGFSDFGVARNYTNISPRRFIVGIKVDPAELWFEYYCLCEKTVYTIFFSCFLLILPE